MQFKKGPKQGKILKRHFIRRVVLLVGIFGFSILHSSSNLRKISCISAIKIKSPEAKLGFHLFIFYFDARSNPKRG